MSTTTNLNTLKINYLTQAQYDTASANNQINENELYLTSSDGAINGTVTSVAASGSGGITISGSPITTSGTIAVGLNLSTAINGLSEGTSPAQLNDYIVAQSAGGGTTTTTYHRRKLSNIIVGKATADQNGLTIDTGYLKLSGGTVTGFVSFTEEASFPKGATGLTRHYGNLNSLGSGTPAAATKNYFVNSVAQNQTGTAYNTSGSEFALLFGRGGNYGTILKFGYDDLYLYKLRYKNSNWLSNDWEKISAGYADSAGSAPNYLPLAGGNVTGPTSFGDSVSIDSATLGNLIVNGKATFNGEISSITFSKDSDIYYAGPYATQRMIHFINGPDVYGHGISIGGGGLAVFGSGESSNTILSSLSLTASGGNETTYITSDGTIELYPNQNSYDAAAHHSITASGIWAGVNGNTTREIDIGVRSGAGQMYMYSAAATNGNRGLYLPAHGTGSAKNIFVADTNNNVTFYGTVSSTSDKKSKDILGIITNAKELILNLKPTHYMWKDGDHRRIHMGFVAQDIAATCKKLNKNLALVVAHYKDNEDKPYYGEDIDDSLLNWGLNYQELIAPIVSVIQEQEQEIQQLKQQLSLIQQYLNLIK